MHWLAQAPSNIALIKYMGKKDADSNKPDNSSLSYTLDNLVSTVKLTLIHTREDQWEILQHSQARPFILSEAGQKKFLNHLARMKKYYGYEGHFLVQSCNNFPHSSGLASSASSFAALTRCAAEALFILTGKPQLSIAEQASLSRLGSGSSCRSFFKPWAIWQDQEVKCIELPYQHLIHQVIIISAAEKAVSSSQAHQRVKTSPHYATRAIRAESHLNNLLEAFTHQNWHRAYQICWQEFQDMHHLFHSCEQPFSYLDETSLSVLNKLQTIWEEKGDGPLVTMDAGPNIHLLYRPDQKELAAQIKQNYLGKYDVL